MNEIIKISTHSFVDLITNSSSELFVCNGQKSVETVKEIINQIFADGLDEEHLDKWQRDQSEKYKGVSPEIVWSELFSDEIIVADRDFDVNTYPHKEELIAVGFGSYYREYMDNESKSYSEISKKIVKELGESPFKDLPYDKRREKKECKEWEEKANEIRQEYSKKQWEEINKITEKIEDYFALPKELAWCIHWGISFKKGDILLKSASDNSIPYAYWDKIERTLNASRYHLG